MTISGVNAIGHIGVCVADLDRSLRFYCEGLGFERVHTTSIKGESMAQLTALEDVRMTLTIIRRDGVALELLHVESPGHVRLSEPAPLNQIGFTHLAVWVADLDEVVRGVVEYGGTVVASQHAQFDRPELTGRFQMCTDPDGVRIELIEYPAAQAAIVGR